MKKGVDKLINEKVYGEKYIDDLLKDEINLFEGQLLANNERLNVYIDKYEAFKRYISLLDVAMNIVKSEHIKISKNMMERITNCSSYFEFETDKTWKHHRVTKNNRCKHKYCPFCARVEALKRTLEAQYMMETLHSKNYRFLFLTLSLKNVAFENVKETMTKINRAFSEKFMKQVDIKKAFEGTIRKFELTYNPFFYRNGKIVKDDCGKKVVDPLKKPFNAHLHFIVAVKQSYFGKRYISQKKMRAIWKKVLKLDYDPMVNIQAIKIKQKTQEEMVQLEKEHAQYLENSKKVTGAFEIGKYVAKDSDYLQSLVLFEQFYQVLHKRRNWTFSGVFKELHKENKNVRFESMLENNAVEYIYKNTYIHNRDTNNYILTKTVKTAKTTEELLNEVDTFDFPEPDKKNEKNL